jgi:phage terminase large subunit-like protein
LTLNLRMREQTRWLDVKQWDDQACDVARKDLRGRRAWGGLDLSAVSDFTAWVAWVESSRPGAELVLMPRFWVPEERVEDLERKLLVPLSRWVDEGHVQTTEGNVIDYAAIKAAVLGDCNHYDMQTVSFDRMFAGQMVQEVEAEQPGVTLRPIAQTYAGLSPSCKELERLLGAQAMLHTGSPVMRWMAAVVEVRRDDADNIRPVKPDRQKATTRIDGIQAAVTGLDGYLRRVDQQADSSVFVFRR